MILINNGCTRLPGRLDVIVWYNNLKDKLSTDERK